MVEDVPTPESAGGKQGKRTKQAGTGVFSPGQSGNPAGKPPGTRNRITVALEQLLEGEAERITRHAIEMAMGGDAVAMRLVLERVLPVRRGRPVQFDYTPLDRAGDVSTLLGTILKSVAEGDLTPEEAATIATIAEAKRKAIETMNFEQRLAVLEADNERRN